MKGDVLKPDDWASVLPSTLAVVGAPCKCTVGYHSTADIGQEESKQYVLFTSCTAQCTTQKCGGMLSSVCSLCGVHYAACSAHSMHPLYRVLYNALCTCVQYALDTFAIQCKSHVSVRVGAKSAHSA